MVIPFVNNHQTTFSKANSGGGERALRLHLWVSLLQSRGVKRPQRLESRRVGGGEVGVGWGWGETWNHTLLQGKPSFQAAWQWPNFHSHSSPEGNKPVLKTCPEIIVQRLSELLQPPQVGTGLKTASARPSLLGWWARALSRPSGCEDTLLAGEYSTNLKVLYFWICAENPGSWRMYILCLQKTVPFPKKMGSDWRCGLQAISPGGFWFS